MAPATPLGERCIENWARALRSEAVSCMLPVGPETKMEIPGIVWPIYWTRSFSSYNAAATAL